MDQQGERVGLGGGGGAPMDQQQGAGSGELATVPGIFSGQGMGQRVPIGYVCHSISFSRNALSAATRGAFRVYGPKDSRGVCHVGGSVLHDPSTLEIQQCGPLWRSFVVDVRRSAWSFSR